MVVGQEKLYIDVVAPDNVEHRLGQPEASQRDAAGAKAADLESTSQYRDECERRLDEMNPKLPRSSWHGSS